MLHISARDRKTRFRMIPQAHWVPDQMASHCQFTSTRPCSVKFSLFQRRHHCRKYVDCIWNVNDWFIYGCILCRCGIVVCQRHSGNRLPLFAKSSAPPQWSRVCDKCFCNLIMTGDEWFPKPPSFIISPTFHPLILPLSFDPFFMLSYTCLLESADYTI